MASVGWDHKSHGATEAKAMLRHDITDERERNQHSNLDIDLTRTSDNVMLGAAVDGYEAACEKYDELMEYATTLPKYRKLGGKLKRVTQIDLNVPAPAGLDEAQQVAFLCDAYEALAAHYPLYGQDGESAIYTGAIHVDEIHDYVDPETKETVTSRVHLHAKLVPITQDGRLSCDAIAKRGEMRALNNILDDLAREKYGVPFMDGTKKKGNSTVEKLKARSAAAEAEQKAQEMLALAKDAEACKDAAEKAAATAEARQKDAENKAAAAEKNFAELTPRVRAARAKIDAAEARERDAEAKAREAEQKAQDAAKKAAEADAKLSRAQAVLDEAEELAAEPVEDATESFLRFARGQLPRGDYYALRKLYDQWQAERQAGDNERARRTARLRSQVDDIQRRGRRDSGLDY